MISFDEAIDVVQSLASPVGTTSVPLSQAAGRVLAAPVLANLHSPRRDVSAMDGYAVRDADIGQLPARLKIIGTSFAGRGWNGALTAGTCARVFTGATVPKGADRVVMQEHVRCEGRLAIIASNSDEAIYIRRRGSDFVAGEQLLARGKLLDPCAMVAVAAADVAEVQVFRSVLLHIISTGDELAEPGTARQFPDSIPDSVSFGVAALAVQWGATCTGITRVADDLAAMQVTARRIASEAEVVVVTGGASVGEKDYAKDMFAPLGLELIFSKVSMKPGKPVWLGRIGERIVVGLPGNPTSAMVTARLFLAALLALMHGREAAVAHRWRSVPLLSPVGPSNTRETFHLGVVQQGNVDVLRVQESSRQKALAEADVLVRQTASSPALLPGEMVDILDF